MKFDDFDTTFDDFGTPEETTKNVIEKKEFLLKLEQNDK